jgi:hypothetical protein
MRSAKRYTIASLAMLGVVSWTTSVLADEASVSVQATGSAATAPTAVLAAAALPTPLEAPAVIRRGPFGSKPIAAHELAARRGGERVVNENQLKGAVSDNRASNLTTGMNVVSEGAFSNSSGMPTLIQNSGNNVLIQNSTIVNVQLKQ